MSNVKSFPMPAGSYRRVGMATSGLLLLLTAIPGKPAAAQGLSLNVEPAAAIWVDKPQGDRFTTGFYGAIRPNLALGSVFSLQLSYALLYTPAGKEWSEAGTAHLLGGGVRIRPLAPWQDEEDQLGGLFVDANANYVRTGPLDRFGYDVGLGYNFQLASWMALGPVLRYSQLIQPDSLMDNNPADAQFISLGLNFAFGPAAKEVEAAECPKATAAECPPQAAPPKKEKEAKAPGNTCPDKDSDGVCNAYDRCPDESGPPNTLGCPIDPCGGRPLSVLVQFDFDSAGMPIAQEGRIQTMDPVLDAVAKAIEQDPSCRVCIIGYASVEGATDYNLDLSHRRADAVQGYMTARGLASKRLPTTGMGDTCQLVPWDTRPMNRRVEFDRLEEGESCPTQCEQ